MRRHVFPDKNFAWYLHIVRVCRELGRRCQSHTSISNEIVATLIIATNIASAVILEILYTTLIRCFSDFEPNVVRVTWSDTTATSEGSRSLSASSHATSTSLSKDSSETASPTG